MSLCKRFIYTRNPSIVGFFLVKRQSLQYGVICHTYSSIAYILHTGSTTSSHAWFFWVPVCWQPHTSFWETASSALWRAFLPSFSRRTVGPHQHLPQQIPIPVYHRFTQEYLRIRGILIILVITSRHNQSTHKTFYHQSTSNNLRSCLTLGINGWDLSFCFKRL